MNFLQSNNDIIVGKNKITKTNLSIEKRHRYTPTIIHGYKTDVQKNEIYMPMIYQDLTNNISNNVIIIEPNKDTILKILEMYRVSSRLFSKRKFIIFDPTSKQCPTFNFFIGDIDAISRMLFDAVQAVNASEVKNISWLIYTIEFTVLVFKTMLNANFNFRDLENFLYNTNDFGVKLIKSLKNVKNLDDKTLSSMKVAIDWFLQEYFNKETVYDNCEPFRRLIRGINNSNMYSSVLNLYETNDCFNWDDVFFSNSVVIYRPLKNFTDVDVFFEYLFFGKMENAIYKRFISTSNNALPFTSLYASDMLPTKNTALMKMLTSGGRIKVASHIFENTISSFIHKLPLYNSIEILENLYYFNTTTKTLVKYTIHTEHRKPIIETGFTPYEIIPDDVVDSLIKINNQIKMRDIALNK